ncbi:MobA/MobL family protein [Pseudooceanicola aestuarii]|uniref:MobA/MobL family protein n=1 Tax=Pseudooceanicola aestuarii TaxID=2697319 RepID=UPI0013CFCF16|nr:MobA/MobL family protein [Pseudooceanicola aestuarii]
MAASYAASINIKHISTSPKARKVLSLTEAIATAKARFRYQTRDAACGDEDVICHTEGQSLTGDKQAVKSKAYAALAARAKKHTEKNGIRLCDTGHISLPNDASTEEQREIAETLVADMAGDSQALVVASIHHDKKGNKHLHWWAVDGLETREAAIARNPEAKRVRQRDQLRLNEGGSRQDWRERMAGVVNQVAEKHGRKKAEHRSLKDQGIDRAPQLHEGVEVQDKLERGHEFSVAANERIESNSEIIAQNIRDQGGSKAKQIRAIPKRWRLPKFLDSWRSKLGFLNRSEVKEEANKTPANTDKFGSQMRTFPRIPRFNKDGQTSGLAASRLPSQHIEDTTRNAASNGGR